MPQTNTGSLVPPKTLKNPPPKSKLDTASDAVRMELYNKGLNDKEIAAMVGVTPSAIWNWRRKLGLQATRGPGRAAKTMDSRSTTAGVQKGHRAPNHLTKTGKSVNESSLGVVPGETESAKAKHAAVSSSPVALPLEPSPSSKRRASSSTQPGLEEQSASAFSAKLDEPATGTRRIAHPSPNPPYLTVTQAAIVVLWRRGYMLHELAEDLKLDACEVCEFLVQRYPDYHQRLDFDTVHALKLLRQGKRDHQIAQALDVEREEITKWRSRHGYTGRRPKAFDPGQARKLFDSGLQDWEIAEKLGGDVTKADVLQWRTQMKLRHDAAAQLHKK